jgi:hypothetical protein
VHTSIRQSCNALKVLLDASFYFVNFAQGDEDEDDAMDEDFDASGYDDGLEIQPEEIEMLKKKKRWRDREVEIRAAHEQEKLKKKKKVGANKEKVENIFTSSAASGILTTEIVNIMDNTKELGFNAKPIDDNIYEWEARLNNHVCVPSTGDNLPNHFFFQSYRFDCSI